jgi:hypothetical protein
LYRKRGPNAMVAACSLQRHGDGDGMEIDPILWMKI